jgi:N-acetylmuramoyl-L-alanine amidase
MQAAGLPAVLLAVAGATSAHATTSGARRTAIDSIIVHAVSGPSCAGGQLKFSGAPGDAAKWKRFFDGHPFLGIHYVVDRDGKVLASTPEERAANHALDNNATSIGIELVHEGDGREPFGEPQIKALIALLDGIRVRHGIALERIKGHGDVDSRTFTCSGKTHKGRSDPGPNFPWIRVLTALLPPAEGRAGTPIARIPEPAISLASIPVPRLVPRPSTAVGAQWAAPAFD